MSHKKNFLRGRNKPIDISLASYVTESSALTVAANTKGLVLKPDGTRLYLGDVTAKKVREYTLSTAWDLSTLGVTQTDISPALSTAMEGFCFGNNGLKLYAVQYNSGILKEYDVSPAWDVSTASFVQNGTISTPSNRCGSPIFTDDGLTLYVLYNSTDDVAQYSLSTAWDISTLSHVATKSSVVAGNVADLKLSSVGDYLYITDGSNMNVKQKEFTTLFDISTIIVTPDITFSPIYIPYGAHIIESLRKMFVFDDTNNKIIEYDL